MKTPFVNDLFGMIYQAFRNLYPGKQCDCEWVPSLPPDKDGTRVLGLTECIDGEYHISVVVDQTVADAAQIFIHELAHVAVGNEEGHNAVWSSAFDAIMDEYNRLGYETFEEHERADSIDGKACFREDT